jgi:hypothetical protein
VYRRGKGHIVTLIHPKLLFRFRHTEEKAVDGLENAYCVRGEYDNLM